MTTIGRRQILGGAAAGLGLAALGPVSSSWATSSGAASRSGSTGVTNLFKFGTIADNNGFAMDDYWIWCPSIIQDRRGTWHMFASRWPRGLPMHPGWLTHSEIVRATARRPEGPYTFREVVLPARGEGHWDGRATHNPRIHVANGRYYLFYTGITYPQAPPTVDKTLSTSNPAVIAARASKRIGVATSRSLTGPWKRPDGPALDVAKDTFYSYLTSNPAPLHTRDGRHLLVFKGRATKPDGGYTTQSLGVAQADRPEGPYRVLNDSHLLAKYGEVEDPFLWEERDGIHMIVKDMFGTITGQKGAGAHFHSRNALKWELRKPEVAWRREVTFDDGRTVTLGNFERPSVLRDCRGRITHLAGAVSDGTNGFGDAKSTHNIVRPVRRVNC